MLESGKATAARHAGLISAYCNDLIDGDSALISRCGHDASIAVRPQSVQKRIIGGS
jgi:hypothetical protein